MTRHISLHNQTTVPVLDRDGAPLAPTRPSRARRWLEIGKAVRRWRHGQFAVQLVNHQADDCTVPEMTLGIDPGTRKDRHGSHSPDPGGIKGRRRRRDSSPGTPDNLCHDDQKGLSGTTGGGDCAGDPLGSITEPESPAGSSPPWHQSKPTS